MLLEIDRSPVPRLRAARHQPEQQGGQTEDVTGQVRLAAGNCLGRVITIGKLDNRLAANADWSGPFGLISVSVKSSFTDFPSSSPNLPRAQVAVGQAYAMSCFQSERYLTPRY